MKIDQAVNQHHRAIRILEAIRTFEREAETMEGLANYLNYYGVDTYKQTHRADISRRAAKRMRNLYFKHLRSMKS
jgi:hypothetical protein